MPLEEDVRTYVGQWREYCNTNRVVFGSNPRDIFDCEAYRGLVALGREALPEIRRAFGEGEPAPFCLSTLIRAVVGNDFQVPEQLSCNADGNFHYSLGWIDGRNTNPKGNSDSRTVLTFDPSVSQEACIDFAAGLAKELARGTKKLDLSLQSDKQGGVQ